VRVQIKKLEDTMENSANKQMKTFIYKVKLTDFEVPAFLILRKKTKDKKPLLDV
jgi:hypothetical protein